MIGETGVPGAVGPQGLQGERGEQGVVGLPGTQGLQGVQGAEGAAGPVGLPGVQGVQGASGPAWLYQPTPAELVAKVREAAFELSPRTLLSPRAGVRYVSTLASRVVKLKGGLLLRAILTTDLAVPARTPDLSNVRAIA